ncbi:MAG TPA: phosphotransferase family protein [Caulobacteraceae bacterium]|nr:phosphotransferase family protein [Caulobacteraceae bacterium]
MTEAGAPSPAGAAAKLAEGLDALARARLGADGAKNLRRMTAGATQEVWRFDLIEHGRETPLVLRRAPGGTRVSDTAVGLETEARLIQAAAAKGVPVPAVRHVLDAEDGLGHGFIMGFVEGETLGGRIVRQEAFAETRTFLARQCGEVLAKIHAIDPAEFPNLRRQTPRQLIDQYHATYKASGWPRPVIDLAFRWLDERCPPDPREMKLVHGDFRNGNLMIGPDGVRAVLDWEIAHVGDPMEDFGWICTGSWRFGQMDKPVGGFGEREDLWAGYEAAGGAPVSRDHALWWEVYGSMRWGVMCASMVMSFRGADPSVERSVIARRTSENEIDLLRLLAA